MIFSPPVIVGGLGGSGTRLVAEILIHLGIYLGSDLNKENDNLWFTLLFKRMDIIETDDAEFQNLVTIFYKAMERGRESIKLEHDELETLSFLASKERIQHNKEWLMKRVESLILATSSCCNNSMWGLKEPNSHILFERLSKFIPKMKYIYVTRNGLDMAYSSNQNQLALWGKKLIGTNDVNPGNSLKFWCESQRRAIKSGSKLGNDFLLFNYDDICLNPMREITKLVEFLEFDVSQEKLQQLVTLVKPPSSIGRHKSFMNSQFCHDDLAYAKQFINVGKKLQNVPHYPRAIFRPSALLGWKLSPNSQVKVRFRNIANQTTDDDGWRTVVKQPAKANKKIAFYGCSFTYGTGLSDDETFTSRLQKHFPNIQIVNRGIGGHGSVQNYLQFRNDVKKSLIDSAVFCVISDHRYRNVCHPVRMRAHLSLDWYKIGVEHVPRVKVNRDGDCEFEYVSIWQPSLFKNDFDSFLPPDFYLDSATLSVFKEIIKFSSSRNIPIKIVLLDSIDMKFNQLMVKEFNIVKDISTPYNNDFTFLPDDSHPNSKANELFYERLVSVVEELIL